jgi:hypothetical protein
MTIPVPSGINSRRGLHRVVADALGLRIVRCDLAVGQTLPGSRGPERMNRAYRLVVEAIGRADPAGACESMDALIASTARGAGSVVEGRPAIGRNT